MKEKFNKETVKKVALGCGLAALAAVGIGVSVGVGCLAAVLYVAGEGYRVVDEAGNIVKIAKKN